MSPLRPISPSQLAEALRSPGCPGPDLLREAAAGELSEAKREAVLAHAASCDACAAELDLACAFEAPEPGSADSGDIAWIVGRLETRRRGEPASAIPAQESSSPQLAKVLSMPPRTARRAPGGWLAAAASVLLAVGGLYLATRLATPPAVPPPPATDVVRSGEIEWTTPLGKLATLPSELGWTAVPGAVRYRIEAVNAATREPLWSGESVAPSLPFPAELRARLAPFTAVALRVEALAANGSTLAVSAPVELRLEP